MSYTFQKTSDGNVQISQDGAVLSTTTPANATLSYGYTEPTPNAPKPVTEAGVVSSQQGVDTITQKNKLLASLTTTPNVNNNQTVAKSLGVDIPGETPNKGLPTGSSSGDPNKTENNVTFIKADTGQEYTIPNPTSDDISKLQGEGWSIMSGTGPASVVSTTPKTKAQTDVDTAAADLKSLSDNLTKYTVSDSQLQSQIDNITNQWNSRIVDMQKVNTSRVGATTQLGYRIGMQFGGGTGGTFGGIISEEERQGVQRIADLESQKQSAISAARTAAMTQNWQVFSKQVDLAQKAYEDKVTALKNLTDATLEQNKLISANLKVTTDNLNAAKKDAYDTALKNNAPQAVLDKISTATTQDEAYSAIVGYGSTADNQVVDINGSKALVDTTTGKIVKWIGGGSGDGSGGSGGTQAVLTDNYKDFLTGRTTDQVAAFTKLSSLDRSVVSQLINGDVLLSDIIKSRGIQGTQATEQLLQKVKSVDPSFSVNTNKIRFDFMKDWQSSDSKIGNTKNAINTALGHLADVKELTAKLTPSDLNTLNKTKNWWNAETGNADITNLQFGLTQLASEIAAVYKGGQPTDSEIQAEKAVLGTQFSSQQFKGIYDTASNFLSSKITAMRYLYKSTMGKEYNQALIDPEKRQSLIDAGIDPNSIVKENVPGSGNQSVGNKVTTALNSTNPATGKAYTSQDVIQFLLKDPDLGPKVKAAMDAGKQYDEIINYLKTL